MKGADGRHTYVVDNELRDWLENYIGRTCNVNVSHDTMKKNAEDSGRPEAVAIYHLIVALGIQFHNNPSPAALDEIIRDEFWGYFLDEETMVQIRGDFEEWVAGRIQEAPKPLTREEKIEKVAQEIVAINMINRPIIQNALRDGRLTTFDGHDVMERAKEIILEKKPDSE